MSFTKINISIPLEIDKKLTELIEKGQKSAFIAKCIKERLEILEKEKLDNQLREGYLIQSKEAFKIAKDFELTDLEGLELESLDLELLELTDLEGLEND